MKPTKTKVVKPRESSAASKLSRQTTGTSRLSKNYSDDKFSSKEEENLESYGKKKREITRSNESLLALLPIPQNIQYTKSTDLIDVTLSDFDEYDVKIPSKHSLHYKQAETLSPELPTNPVDKSKKSPKLYKQDESSNSLTKKTINNPEELKNLLGSSNKKCKCRQLIELNESKGSSQENATEQKAAWQSQHAINDNSTSEISLTYRYENKTSGVQLDEDLSKTIKDRSRNAEDNALILRKQTDYTPIEADDIGRCFARGFRPDNMLLSGDACFNLNKQDKIKMSPHMLKNTESIIDFSERETPLDFLLALGFMVDEASNALKDDDIRSRLLAAITEARVWINKITTTQGTLLYLVAYKSRPETMRYFLQLVEAIINKRISNAIKLDGYLRVLEQVEDGRLELINILGESKFEDEENEEKIVKKQLRHLFITIYKVAEKEALDMSKNLTTQQVDLLRILVAKYRAGLHPHLELIARYIGQSLLNTETQLEAAMIFLSRLDTADVKLKEFENYCGITCTDVIKKNISSEEEIDI